MLLTVIAFPLGSALTLPRLLRLLRIGCFFCLRLGRPFLRRRIVPLFFRALRSVRFRRPVRLFGLIRLLWVLRLIRPGRFCRFRCFFRFLGIFRFIRFGSLIWFRRLFRFRCFFRLRRLFRLQAGKDLCPDLRAPPFRLLLHYRADSCRYLGADTLTVLCAHLVLHRRADSSGYLRLRFGADHSVNLRLHLLGGKLRSCFRFYLCAHLFGSHLLFDFFVDGLRVRRGDGASDLRAHGLLHLAAHLRAHRFFHLGANLLFSLRSHRSTNLFLCRLFHLGDDLRVHRLVHRVIKLFIGLPVNIVSEIGEGLPLQAVDLAVVIVHCQRIQLNAQLTEAAALLLKLFVGCIQHGIDNLARPIQQLLIVAGQLIQAIAQVLRPVPQLYAAVIRLQCAVLQVIRAFIKIDGRILQLPCLLGEAVRLHPDVQVHLNAVQVDLIHFKVCRVRGDGQRLLRVRQDDPRQLALFTHIGFCRAVRCDVFALIRVQLGRHLQGMALKEGARILGIVGDPDLYLHMTGLACDFTGGHLLPIQEVADGKAPGHHRFLQIALIVDALSIAREGDLAVLVADVVFRVQHLDG